MAIMMANANEAVRLVGRSPNIQPTPTLKHVHLAFVALLGCIGILLGNVAAGLKLCAVIGIAMVFRVLGFMNRMITKKWSLQ